MNTRNCVDCVYWGAPDEFHGLTRKERIEHRNTCQRHAPVTQVQLTIAGMSYGGDGPSGVWPMTYGSNGCGDF